MYKATKASQTGPIESDPASLSEYWPVLQEEEDGTSRCIASSLPLISTSLMLILSVLMESNNIGHCLVSHRVRLVSSFGKSQLGDLKFIFV